MCSIKWEPDQHAACQEIPYVFSGFISKALVNAAVLLEGREGESFSFSLKHLQDPLLLGRVPRSAQIAVAVRTL